MGANMKERTSMEKMRDIGISMSKMNGDAGFVGRSIASAIDKHELLADEKKQREDEAIECLEFVRRLNPTQNLISYQSHKWCVEIDGERMLASSKELHDLYLTDKNKTK